MLDRAQVIHQLQQRAAELFVDLSSSIRLVHEAWLRMIEDPRLPEFAEQWRVMPRVPEWLGSVQEITFVERGLSGYCVSAVDGSQIYPDRHQGTSCFLINIGVAAAAYAQNSSFSTKTVPHVFIPQVHEAECCVDWVNARRQELEFQMAGKLARRGEDPPTHLLLFDGALIFWHLEQALPSLQDEFVPRYTKLLNQLYEARQPIAGYISAPRNRELLYLLRLFLSAIYETIYDQYLDLVLDVHLMHRFLPPCTRTTVFINKSSLSWAYQAENKPCFFYLNNGYEVGRVEIPYWVAQNTSLVNWIAELVIDQSIKGGGYPIMLAEAHEQAVVKNHDREFFYQYLAKISMQQQQCLIPSYKSLKKRFVGV
jgi:hypothetical protein